MQTLARNQPPGAVFLGHQVTTEFRRHWLTANGDSESDSQR